MAKLIKASSKEVPTTDNDIQDIDLSSLRKKRFRIDGDNNRVIELNTSDAGFVVRLNQLYPKMKNIGNELSAKINDQSSIKDDDSLGEIAEIIINLDNELKAMMDELFDSNVSEVCMPEGTSVDPINGEFRFETIIRKLGKLYIDNFNSEFTKMKNNVSKHTAKYTKSRKK